MEQRYDNQIEIVKWFDGNYYVKGHLHYPDLVQYWNGGATVYHYNYPFDLPLTPDATSADKNHFVASGKLDIGGRRLDLKIDLYAFEGQIYTAVSYPHDHVCNSATDSTRFATSFNWTSPSN